MNSQEYWNSRAMKRLTSAERKANQHIDKINKIYLKANLNIQQQIANIYKNYSKETGIDVDTLKELLSKKETDAFWKTMEGKGLKQYVKSNYKSRITRLEQIQAQLYAQAKGVYDEELRESTELYKDIINDSYYKTVYDTAIGTGYDFSFNKIDERTFETILNEKWLGSNYSQRIWKNTDIVADKISEVIGGSLISGQPMQYAINELINIFGVGRYYAERLVRTETNHFNSEAEALAYEELNVKKYVFVATLDSKTSEICQEHDHKVYELDKRQPGENYPPLHPNCRSTVRAYLGEEEERMLKRRAVNPITGKVEYIDNISYKDWINRVKTDELLTKNEKTAITNYTGFDARNINMSLRTGKISNEMQQKINLIDSAMSKSLPLASEKTVYRGALHTNFDVFKDKGNRISNEEMLSLKDKIIQDKGFVSTGRYEAQEAGRNVIMKIRLPKGFKGAIDIKPYAVAKYKYQEEILLNRGCQFKVNDVIIRNNKYYLDVEVIK